MLTSSIHITLIDMALGRIDEYVQLQDIRQVYSHNKLGFQEEVDKLIQAGFTDISISRYLNFVASNPKISDDYPAIKVFVLAKIEELTDQDEIETGKFRQAILLLDYIDANLTQINTLTVAGFKDYLLSQPISPEDAAALNVSVLDLNEDLQSLVQQSNINTVGQLMDLLKSLVKRGIRIDNGSTPYDFSDCIAKLYKMKLFSRIEAEVYIKCLNRGAGQLDLIRLLGANTSEEYPEIPLGAVSLDSSLHFNLFINGYHTVGEIKFMLLEISTPLLLNQFSKKSIKEIASQLIQKGYITQDQFIQILAKYDIPLEV